MSENGYDNTNRGALFNNPRKQNDRQPDMTGRINIDGQDYWLSGWFKQSRRDGSEYLSLALGDAVGDQVQQQARPAPRQQPQQRQFQRQQQMPQRRGGFSSPPPRRAPAPQHSYQGDQEYPDDVPGPYPPDDDIPI